MLSLLIPQSSLPVVSLCCSLVEVKGTTHFPDAIVQTDKAVFIFNFIFKGKGNKYIRDQGHFIDLFSDIVFRKRAQRKEYDLKKKKVGAF